MNTFKVFYGGHKDEKGNYVGGTLDSVWKSEKQAFERKRELNFKLPFKQSYILYILREGEERFTIVPYMDGYSVTDKETMRYSYGFCKTLQEAEEHKAWCEKYHTEGWYY